MDHQIEAFRGFGPDLVAFYTGLEQDNSKRYFDEHRSIHDTQIRLPMEQLLAEVADEFGDQSKVFRPNRDTRFSKDKSPYKLNCYAVATDDDPATAACYLSVSADGLVAASGYYQLARDQLDRYLSAVDDDTTGPELEALVTRARDQGMEVWGSELKTSPRGYPNDHPRVALLRHKGITVARRWKPYKWLQTREALHRVTGLWRDAEPLNEWLRTNVGPSRAPARDGRR